MAIVISHVGGIVFVWWVGGVEGGVGVVEPDGMHRWGRWGQEGQEERDVA